ncbi:MAG: hypothetical protein KDK26_09865 [Roseivivax sp.]|nr:hypothetical protein [Roseivivax sp.]
MKHDATSLKPSATPVPRSLRGTRAALFHLWADRPDYDPVAPKERPKYPAPPKPVRPLPDRLLAATLAPMPSDEFVFKTF